MTRWAAWTAVAACLALGVLLLFVLPPDPLLSAKQKAGGAGLLAAGVAGTVHLLRR